MFKWSDEETMFEHVNAVDYGLTASIWTRDLVTAHRAARRVEAGYVWINNSSAHFHGAPVFVRQIQIHAEPVDRVDRT